MGILKSPILKGSVLLESIAEGENLLKKGSKYTKAIKSVQTALHALGIDLRADGDFGAKTQSRVKVFQSTFKATNTVHEGYSVGAVDGIVGRGTLLGLDEALVSGWDGKINWAETEFAYLLGSVESKNDYSAYNDTYPKLISRYNTDLITKSIEEVMQRQEDGEYFAVGRFQLIPSTLERAVKVLNLNVKELFDKRMQDHIFNEYLIAIKRKDILNFLIGQGSVETAIYAWAKEFASAGVRAGMKISKGRTAKGGESYYAGDGFNKAHLSPDEMVEALERSKL